MAKTMLGKWDYSGVDSVCYSDNEQESYKKSAEFLGDTVEDWGGGTGWAKRYFKNYKNIDGSLHPNVDEVIDLVKYTSKVENILLRQVLSLNEDWEKIIDNAKRSFSKKLCIVVFTPFSEGETKIGEVEPAKDCNDGLRGFDHILIFFKKQDILDCFPASEFKVSEEVVETQQGYKRDWILYVERL